MPIVLRDFSMSSYYIYNESRKPRLSWDCFTLFILLWWYYSQAQIYIYTNIHNVYPFCDIYSLTHSAEIPKHSNQSTEIKMNIFEKPIFAHQWVGNIRVLISCSNVKKQFLEHSFINSVIFGLVSLCTLLHRFTHICNGI